MSYAQALRGEMTLPQIVRDIVARIYAAHASDGNVGYFNLGMLPRGRGSVLYHQNHFEDDSTIEVLLPGGKRCGLGELETPDLVSALTVIDRRFALRGAS